MDSCLYSLANSLNNLVSKQFMDSDMAILFDSIAEILRSNDLKIRLLDASNRNFEIELYWALERKNTASYLSDFEESDRLKMRIKHLMVEKKIQEDKTQRRDSGSFFVENNLLLGQLNRIRKNERILLQLLQAYDLIY